MRVVKSENLECLIKKLKKNNENEYMIELIAQEIYLLGAKESIDSLEKELKTK